MSDRSQDEAELRKIVTSLVELFAPDELKKLDDYVTLYSEDTDWENVFGWRVRGRQRLKEFLEFIWPRHVGSSYGPFSYRVELLLPDLALVEYSSQRIPPADSLVVNRLFCGTHILRRQNGAWEVILTRLWEPRTVLANPVEEFPEFKDAPISGMRPLK